MSNDTRDALLSRYMDRLRETNPSASSNWIRAKAEELVVKKLGPATPPKPPERISAFAEVVMPAPAQAEISTPPPPPTQTEQPSSQPKITSLPDHASSLVQWGSGFLVFGIVLIVIGVLRTEQLEMKAQTAIQETTAMVISNGWWLGGIGFMIVGMISIVGGRICEQIRSNSVRLSQVLVAIAPDQSNSAD